MLHCRSLRLPKHSRRDACYLPQSPWWRSSGSAHPPSVLGQYTPVPYGHSWHVLDPLKSIECLPYPSDVRFFLSCTALGPVWLTCVPVRTSSIDIPMGHVVDRVFFAAAVSEWYVLPRNSCGFTPLRGPLLEPRCRADPNPKHITVSTYDNETEAANEFVGSIISTRLHDGLDIVS